MLRRKTMRVHALIAAGAAAALAWPARAQNTVVLENRSGEPALVKLVGPTAAMVRVPEGARLDLDAAAGRYFVKVRYGVPGRYRYSRGDEFSVLETATARSETLVRLPPPGEGNVQARGISKANFDDPDFGLPVWRERVARGEGSYSSWVEIVRDPTLKAVWPAAEAAYREAIARGDIPPGRDNDLIGFADMIRTPLGGVLARDSVVAQFGTPRQVREEGGVTWLDYGPIQLGLERGQGGISTFRALRGFYTQGFAAVAGQAVRQAVGAETGQE